MSILSDGKQVQRQTRINALLKSIEKVYKTGWKTNLFEGEPKEMEGDKTCQEEMLISESQRQFGASRRLIKEYLDELENAGLIIIEDHKVYSAEAYKSDLVLKTVKDKKEHLPEFKKESDKNEAAINAA